MGNALIVGFWITAITLLSAWAVLLCIGTYYR